MKIENQVLIALTKYEIVYYCSSKVREWNDIDLDWNMAQFIMGTKVFVQNYLFLFIVFNRCRILIIFENIASLTVVSAAEMR